MCVVLLITLQSEFVLSRITSVEHGYPPKVLQLQSILTEHRMGIPKQTNLSITIEVPNVRVQEQDISIVFRFILVVTVTFFILVVTITFFTLVGTVIFYI